MIRRAMKILGLVIVLVASAWVGLFLTAKTVTLEEAEQIAIQKVQRSAERLRFNAAVFRGPELVDVQPWGYAFRWVFSDAEGTVEMLVWVDEYGGTEISWEGDLERLKTRQ
jgi:ABC-type uncharacterized transport system YnjBCD permease subunit